MRERREVPRIEGLKANKLILQLRMRELLEVLQCVPLTHFAGAGADEGAVVDGLMATNVVSQFQRPIVLRFFYFFFIFFQKYMCRLKCCKTISNIWRLNAIPQGL
jgi:hypothetical protein